MQKITLVIILLFPLYLYAGKVNVPDSLPRNCIEQAAAEKILGRPATRKECTTQIKNTSTVYKCRYAMVTTGQESNKATDLYCVVDEYTTVAGAVNAYVNAAEANRNMQGQIMLKGIGDQALLYTDDKNFLMITCRKGNKLLRLKINKLNSYTSKEALLDFAKAFK